MVITLVVARVRGDGSSIVIALRDMFYRSNIGNDDDDDDDDDNDDDDDDDDGDNDGSIHVSIQYTTTTINS